MLKSKTLPELYEMLKEKQKERFNLRIQMRTMQGGKPHIIRDVRRSIARIKTRMAQINLIGKE
ncbi:MAG: 50S ribosomal protein L29 [Holosporales bacterium]|nr:50S ribosomal protein L29 [Holosporales bacterium]